MKTLFMGILGISLVASLLSCGAKSKQYTPDYVIEAKRISKEELYKDKGRKFFDPKVDTVKWIKEKREYKLSTVGHTITSRSISVDGWEVEIVSSGIRSGIRATHLATGRTYEVKLNIPFAMTHVGVAKSAGDILYIKEPLDGKVYVLDPHKPNKEVGIMRRAYLYDDGIVVIGGDVIKFCKNYNMRDCVTLYELDKKGYFGKFFRSNNVFIFYVRDYRWNDKAGGYRWKRAWLVVDSNGKKVWSQSHIDRIEYDYPFWELADKQYVYSRRDYYSNPYYMNTRSKPKIPYKSYAPPAVYEKDGKVYIFSHGQKAGTFKSYTSVVVVDLENSEVVFKKVKLTNLFYADYALGFCGDKVIVNFDGVWYNPEDNKKVQCGIPIVTLFRFGAVE